MKEKKLTYYDQMDEILKYLSTNKEKLLSAEEIRDGMNIKIEHRLLTLMLQQLDKDEYVLAKPNVHNRVPDEFNSFMILFKGILFIELDGGYHQKYQREISTQERQENDREVSRRNENILWIATASLVVVEIIKIMLDHPGFLCHCY